MLLPVVRIDTGVFDGVARVDHHAVSHIDTHMGNRAVAVIGFRKENQISGPCVSGRYIGALIENPCCRGAGQVVDAAGRIDPADKAGTVKGGRGAGAAPYIGPAQVLFRLRDKGRKGRVGKSFAWYGVITSGVIAATAARVNVIPQIAATESLPGYQQSARPPLEHKL